MKHRWKWTDAALADTDETGIARRDVIDVLEGDAARRIESWAPGGELGRVWAEAPSGARIVVTCERYARFSRYVWIKAVRHFTDAETKAWEG